MNRQDQEPSMKVYSRFATDPEAEQDGVWVALDEGARLRVARYGNPRHEAALERLRRPYRDLLRAGGEIPPEAARAIAVAAAAEALLLDWEGLEDEAGRPLPYSREAACRLLGDLKDFRDTVARLAVQAERYRRAGLERAEKNCAGRPAAGPPKATARPAPTAAACSPG